MHVSILLRSNVFRPFLWFYFSSDQQSVLIFFLKLSLNWVSLILFSYLRLTVFRSIVLFVFTFNCVSLTIYFLTFAQLSGAHFLFSYDQMSLDYFFFIYLQPTVFPWLKKKILSNVSRLFCFLTCDQLSFAHFFLFFVTFTQLCVAEFAFIFILTINWFSLISTF